MHTMSTNAQQQQTNVPGFITIPVEGDGHCLFRALSMGIAGLLGSSNRVTTRNIHHHRDLRDAIVEFVLTQPDLLAVVTVPNARRRRNNSGTGNANNSTNRKVAAYVAEMGTSGYGGEPEIVAFTRLYA